MKDSTNSELLISYAYIHMTIKAIHGRQTYLCFHEISVYGDGTFMVSLVSLLHVLHGWMGKGRSTEEIQTGMNWKLLCTMARGTRRSFWALIQLNSAKNQLLVDCTTLLNVRITESDPNLLHDGSWRTLACLQLWHALPWWTVAPPWLEQQMLQNWNKVL